MKGKRAMAMLLVCAVINSVCVSDITAAAAEEEKVSTGSNRTEFITSNTDIDELLRREYVDNVPLGYSEDLFSLYQPGWGFDRQDVYRTGIASGFGMPVTVTANQIPILVQDAEFTPSVVTSTYIPEETTGPRLVKTNISLNAKSIYNGAQTEAYPRVDASFSQEQWGRALAQAYQGTQEGDSANWNTFRTAEDSATAPVPEGGDWTSIEFSKEETIHEIRIHTFADAHLAYPDKITAYAWDNDNWNPIAVSEGKSEDGWYTLELSEAVSSSKFKLAFEVEEGKALAADLIEYLQYSYDESGLETYEVNHAAGAGRDSYPLASASFSQETWGASLEYAFDADTSFSANQGWNTYRQSGDYETSPIPAEGDWITLEFEEPTQADALSVYVYSDNGNTLPPDDIRLMYETEGNWVEVTYQDKPQTYLNGKNTLTFDSVSAKKYKVIFKEKSGKCVSLNELELIETILTKPQKIAIKGYKYISPDNMLVSIVEAENLGEEASTVEVSASIPTEFDGEGSVAAGALVDLEAQIQGDPDFQKIGARMKKQAVLEPNEKTVFKIALSLSKTQEENETKLAQLLSDTEPVATQKARFTEWFEENIPYLDVPDETMKQIYYFRWYTYRNHIRKTTEDYYIISEFLPNVSWAGKHNSINCPAGLHVAEGRWLQNSEYLDDYLAHWLDNGGAVRSYSFWIADAYYNRYLATGNESVLDYVDKLKSNFEAWSDHYNADLGLYWQLNDRDGMENSISSAYGYRPTINSYMYGDAVALSKLCGLIGDEDGEKLYTQKAEAIKESFDAKTWDEEENFYKVIACNWDGTLTNGETLQDVKEEIGYIPWMFNLPDDDAEHAAAWSYVMDEEYFLAPYGILTAEKSYARTTPEGEYGTGICRWDGPVWPFATSQTLTGMANLLNNYHQDVVTNEDYFYLLKNYAQSQYKNGEPWIAENLDGYSGRWIADERRSPNYNHSSFNDLVISGLFGIRPQEGDTLTLNPLIPEGEWDSFCLENVPYHGKNITILYDKTGSVYGAGSGFQVYVDGRLAYVSEKPESVEIPLEGMLDNIQVTPPAKVEYQVGEAFEEAGMEVTAYYTDGTKKELKAGQYHVSGFDSAVTGTRTITVSYTEEGVEKTAQFTVTIIEKTQQSAVLERLELTKPAKVEYQVGEEFQSSGMKVVLCYSDGSRRELSPGEYQISGFDSSSAGNKTVTVSYTEKGVRKEAAFVVTIYEKPGAEETARKGEVFQYKGLRYKVTKVSGKKGNVLVTGPVSKRISKVTIPKTVTVKGVTCTVVKINKNAFKNCKKLSKVTIGANVETIGKGAFRNCAKLKSVIVKSKKVKSVKKNAFKGIHKKAVIKVPKSKRKAYARKLKKAQTNTITVR